MSVPPELMQLIAGGAGKSGGGMPPAAGAGAPPQPVPGGAPMSTPQPAHGDKQSAMVNVTLAMDLLEQTLPALGSESEEGSAILSALSGLSRKFGHTRAKSQELVPAELQQLFQSLPQAGGANPVQKAMAGAGGMPGAGAPGAPGAPQQPMPQAA